MTRLLGPDLKRTVALFSLALLASRGAPQEGAAAIGASLLEDAKVREVLEAVRVNEPQVLDDQARLCEIEAPSFQEQARAAVMRAEFEKAGLQNIRIDAVGNVLGERPGRQTRPRVVVAAHLDTVFPSGTDLRVRREGAILKGPGIGDNCRGLAALLGMVRALQRSKIETTGPITFVANVGEEALGNLRGARHLFEVELKDKIDRFVSIDGSGTGFVHLGVGAHRYKVTVKGPGGHSYFAFGNANPVHALGRAITHIGDIQVPKDPRTTFSVGRINGGTSINSIAFEAWMEIDMRSHDAEALDTVDQQIHQAVAAGVQEENARWSGKGAVAAVWESVGDRQPGMTPLNAPIVQATISVTRALGLPVQPFPATTDSNIAMALGVPAVTLDGGGDGSGGHSLGEFFDSKDSWKGTQRALLLALALTRP